MKLSLVTCRQDDQETDYTGRTRIMASEEVCSRFPRTPEPIATCRKEIGKTFPDFSWKGPKYCNCLKDFCNDVW